MTKKIIGYKVKIKTPWCEKGDTFQINGTGDSEKYIIIGLTRIIATDYPDLFEPVYEEPTKSQIEIYNFLKRYWEGLDSLKVIAVKLSELVPDLADRIKNSK